MYFVIRVISLGKIDKYEKPEVLGVYSTGVRKISYKDIKVDGSKNDQCDVCDVCDVCDPGPGKSR